MLQQVEIESKVYGRPTGSGRVHDISIDDARPHI